LLKRETFLVLVERNSEPLEKLVNQLSFRTNEIKQFVLDEADEMLSRGFKDQIYDVFRHLNPEIQVTFICYLSFFLINFCFLFTNKIK